MEDRLLDLEIRYTLQQDLLFHLSDEVAHQAAALGKLKAELAELRGRRANEPLPFDPDEQPPHY